MATRGLALLLCVLCLLAAPGRCHAQGGFLKGYMEGMQRRQQYELQQQQQRMYEEYVAAEMARLRAEQDALLRQQEFQREYLRLEGERQRQAREQAESERLRIEAEQLRQQMAGKRAEIEAKLFDRSWRNAVGDATAGEHLVLYNQLSAELGLPAIDKLPQLQDPELSQEQLAAKVTPAVVLVRHRDTAGNWTTGTGFLISSTGDVLTCAHVLVNGANPTANAKPMSARTWVRVIGSSGTEAEVTFANSKWDIALLKIAGQDLSCLEVAESNPKQGEAVFAFGYPLGDSLGNEPVVTSGIVSAMRLGDAVFQLDAAINPGNSGGPVVNKQGSVVGIAWAKLRDYEGTNFALSASTIQSVIVGTAE